MEELLKKLNVLCNGTPIFDIDRIDANIQKYNALIQDVDKSILEINEKLKNITLVKRNIDEAQNLAKILEIFAKGLGLLDDYDNKTLDFSRV